MSLTLSLLLALPAPAADGRVDLSGGRWEELRVPEAPVLPGAPALVAPIRRQVSLSPTATGDLRVVASWRVLVAKPGAPALLPLLRRGRAHVVAARVDGRPAALVTDDEGTLSWAGTPERSFTLELEAVLPAAGHPEQAFVDLLGAGAGEILTPADWRVADARWLGPGRFAGSDGAIRLVPPAPTAHHDRLVLGEVGLGLTFGEPDLRVRARLRWRVAEGELSTVAFRAPGAGPDLEVTGAQVGRWSREGDRVVVELLGPERALVDLAVRWSAAVPQGEEASVRVPEVALEGVFRTDASLELARDGTLDLVPRVSELAPAAFSDRPAFAEGLVEGTPTAVFLGGAVGGDVDVLRFSPADSPATLVDVAAITAAVSDDGHVLMRAHYAVRNDRGGLLRVVPPPGLVPVAVRVAGVGVPVSRDGDAWLVPLERSVESVRGLLSFGVELTFLGEQPSWSRRDRRVFPLPTLDVETAVTRVTLHLPPGFESRLRSGRDEVVDAFTEGEGITYGFAVGDTRVAAADALFQQAVDAWMGNDFDGAKQRLDDLKSLGANNADISGLEGNLKVVDGEDDAEDVAVNRRILEQARARAGDEVREQQDALLEAREAEESGRYEAAAQAYDKAGKLGESLGRLSNDEDLSQAKLKDVAEKKVAENVYKKAQQESIASGRVAAPENPSAVPLPAGTGSTTPGGLQVVVTDQEYIPVPGAEVSVQSPALVGGPRTLVTDGDGRLDLADLAPGTYDLVVQRPGFAGTRVSNLEVADGRTTHADAQLRPTVDEEVLLLSKSEPEPMFDAPVAVGGGFLGAPGAPGASKNEALEAMGYMLGNIDSPPEPARKSDRGPKGAAAPMAAPVVTAEPALPADAPLAVTAAQASVVVPTQGVAVLYQQLLSPAGATRTVRVDARRSRRSS